MLRARTGKLPHPIEWRVEPLHHPPNMTNWQTDPIKTLIGFLNCTDLEAAPLFHESLTRDKANKKYREFALMVHPDRKTPQCVNSTHFPLLVQKLEEYKHRKQKAEKQEKADEIERQRKIQRQRKRQRQRESEAEGAEPRARKANRCATDGGKGKGEGMVVSSCLMKWGFSDDWGNELNFKRKMKAMGVKVSATKKGATHLVYGDHDRCAAVAEVEKQFLSTGSGVVLVHENALQKLIEDYLLEQVKCRINDMSTAI